ncbi:MAG: hypothetical protein IEMM0002_0870 [bacterium]|nr:MAG: hypothetical protein IEMM0002_0870 [bacterium]
MIFQASSVRRAASMYDLQIVYGERLMAYKPDKQVVQVQKDRVTISGEAYESLVRHRKRDYEKPRMTYPNPRITANPL